MRDFDPNACPEADFEGGVPGVATTGCTDGVDIDGAGTVGGKGPGGNTITFPREPIAPFDDHLLGSILGSKKNYN